jgi:hypothetical protein
MPYYDAANLVTVTKMNLILEMPCGYGTQDPLLWEYGTKSSADLCRGLSNSKIWLCSKSNLVAFWIHLHNCRFSQEHLTILLQCLRALCLAPGGPASIWNYLVALVMAAGVSGRFACSFRTDLHFADVQVTSQRSRLGPQKRVDSLPYQSKNPTCWLMAVQTNICTLQPAEFATYV